MLPAKKKPKYEIVALGTIAKELREMGFPVSFSTAKKLHNEGLFSVRVISSSLPSGKIRNRYITSRKEAEIIKRLIWRFYMGKQSYPEDEQYGK